MPFKRDDWVKVTQIADDAGRAAGQEPLVGQVGQIFAIYTEGIGVGETVESPYYAVNFPQAVALGNFWAEELEAAEKPTFRYFTVTALEYFETLVTYENVLANSPEEAAERVRTGKVESARHTHPGNDDRFEEVTDTEEVTQ